jgi:hypothetical protein
MYPRIPCELVADYLESEKHTLGTTANKILLYVFFWVIPRRLNFICTYLPMKMEQSVPKRRHIKFRRRGITQKKKHTTYRIWRKFEIKNKNIFFPSNSMQISRLYYICNFSQTNAANK